MDQPQQKQSAARITVPEPAGRTRLRALWNGACAVIGAVLGLVPHVLHHIGILLGAAVVTGAAGSVLFGTVGLLLSIPFLVRLRRRFHSWWAPAIALALFTGAFAVSTFVIGPAIAGDGATPAVPSAPAPAPSSPHATHHQG